MINKKSKTSLSERQFLFYASVLLLLLLLIPLFVISHYNFMSVDDYSYIQSSVVSWRENHSVLEVLRHQFVYAYNYYFSWQGTFSMEWLGSSFMVMVSEYHYYLGTYLILGSFVISDLILFFYVGTKILGADKYNVGIVAIWITALQIMMIPYPVEAFYWLCGALLYTFGYSLTLFLFTLMLVFIRRKGNAQKKPVADIFIQAGMISISFLVAFGNYVSAIFCFTFFLILVIAAWISKINGRGIITLDAAIYTLFFVLNITAPGNRNRVASAGAGEMSAVKAVIKAVLAAAEYVVVNFHPTIVIILMMMVPFMIGIVKNKAFEEKKAFRFPLFFSVISFGLFACQFVPTMYTLGILGAGRIQNMYRFTLYLLYFSNAMYWIGYILRRIHEDHTEFTEEVLVTRKNYLIPAFVTEFCIFCFASYFYGGITMTSVSAFNSLRTGQARVYYEEYRERLEVMNDPGVTDAYVKKYSNPPYVLFFGDLQDNPDAWENRDMAKFYGKNSVHLEP